MILSSPRRTRSTLTLVTLLALLPVCARAEGPAPAASPGSASASLIPKKGSVIAPFTAARMDGTRQTVDFPKGGPTILLFFLSSCPACHKMLPEWNQMYARRAKGVTVYGIVMDQPPPGFFVASPLAFPVLLSPGPEFTKLLNVQRVPTTVRVSPGGRVEDAALGQLDPIRLGEMFRGDPAGAK
jgi:thiol-disulfide isomerase/thioredoxin